ncbi:MAG: PatB family C-S lyase [Candidatus Cloacimonadaceae bacterium]|nr:PatB family C-S lyase [Candidatus Cloacimonadaceae bacterium]MDP3113450.1 PatB family C-S lyase [Candidatus Cloacimonadaceae bacterium]
MNFDFDTVIDRRGSGCFKYDALKSLYGRDDLISLWVADMDFAIAPQITEALNKRLQHGVYGYNFHMPRYYESVVNWVLKRYAWAIHEEWIVNTPGIVPAINMAVLSLTHPGDRVLIQTPVYRPFFNAITDHDRCLLTNSLINVNNRYSINFDDFEKKLRTASLFILCSPHNPVGRLWTDEELGIMGALCKRYKVPIVSDEIHADLVYDDGMFIPIASLDDFADNVITCISPAKSFNIAGLCSAAIIIKSTHLRAKISGLNQKMHLYLGNSFGIEAVTAAYTEGEDWLEALMVYLAENKNLLREFLCRELPMLSMVEPESTYLAWLGFHELGLDDNALFDFLTNKARVALDPGRKFGVDGSRFSRLNFACPRSVLQEGLDRLKYTIDKEL